MLSDDRLSHLADIPPAPSNVRYWGKADIDRPRALVSVFQVGGVGVVSRRLMRNRGPIRYVARSGRGGQSHEELNKRAYVRSFAATSSGLGCV
jgi:hypothetical protein